MTNAKKILRYSIYGLLALILLFTAALMLVTTIINPNSYKHHIVNAASKAMNRQISINGDLDWSIIPFGVTINDFKIANDPKFSAKQQNIIAAKKATISLQFIPLLSNSYKINSITIDNAEIYLAKLTKDKNSYYNWQSISAQDQDTSTHQALKLNTENTKASLDLTIKKINITHSNLLWEDLDKNGEKIILKDIELSSNNFSMSNYQPINFTGSFNSSIASSGMTAATDFEINATKVSTGNSTKINLDIEKLKIKLGGKPYPRHPSFNIKAKSAVNVEAKTFSITNLTADINNILLSGNLNGKLGDQTLARLDGDIKIAKSNLNDFFYNLSIEQPKQFYQNLSGKFEINTLHNIINIKPVSIKLDDEQITGFIKVDTSKQPYIITSDISAENFNLDKLTAKQSNESTESTAKATSANTNNSPSNNNTNAKIFPDSIRQLFKQYELNQNVHITNLIFNETKFTNLESKTSFKNNIVNSNTKFNIYNGKVIIDTNINMANSIPKWQGKVNITELALPSQKITGNANVLLTYLTTGNNTEQLLSNLNGNVDFNLSDGYLNGIDLNAVVTSVNNKLSVGPDRIMNLAQTIAQTVTSLLDRQSHSNNDYKTKLLNVKATGIITNGVLSNNDLLADTTYVKITGKGYVYLTTNTLNYKIILADKNKDNSSNINIPIILTGNLYSPNYNVDAVELLQSKLFESLLKHNIKHLDNLGKKLRIDKGLEKLDKILNF